MRRRQEDQRGEIMILDIEALMPSTHLLRKVDKLLDWSYVYELTDKYYSEDNGRPPVDAVVLVKMAFLQHLYGIPSLRKTVAEIDVNIAYRWFLRFNLSTKIPHFATVSYAFATRFPSEVFQEIFSWVLATAVSKKLVNAENIFIDATHIRANANKKKKYKTQAEITARTYDEQLREEINADRVAHGKKPLKPPSETEPKTKEVSKSITDPDCGVFRKGEHQTVFAYTAHTICDENGIVLEADVASANVHDSTMFDELYKETIEKFEEVKRVAMDSAYKTPWIMKQVIDSERLPCVPYKRPMTKDGYFKKYEYVYDEAFDCVLCPANQVLSYATTNREGYREYKSKPYICKNCPNLNSCTQSKNHQKTVMLHIWGDYMEQAEEIRHTPEGQATYALRKETIERVFADAKEKHSMRYTFIRGLDRVRNWVRLKFAAMNLKKIAMWAV